MTSNMDEQIDELYKSMHKTMEGVAYRLLGDITTAEDAVHETFAALMFNWDTLSSHPNLRGWLIVALRRVISWTRRPCRWTRPTRCAQRTRRSRWRTCSPPDCPAKTSKY